MIIRRTTRNKKHVYEVCNSVQDTGRAEPETIAEFETLEQATAVMRLLRGDHMSATDEITATQAIKKAAATTNHSADSRQKG